MDRHWHFGAVILLVLLATPGATTANEAKSFLEAMGRNLAQSTQVIACQDCSEDQVRLAALDVAAAGMPFVDSNRDNLVYVVDPVRDVVKSFRYIQETDGRGASAHVILADGSDGDREAIREALDYYHAITEFTEVEFSDLPRSDTLKFDSAFDLAVHEYSRRQLALRLHDYIKENFPFETKGSGVKIAAFGALTGLLNDKLGLPSENNEVMVKFADGSSWAFELESFNLEITSGSTSVDVAFMDDGGRDPAGNQLYPGRGGMYGREITGNRDLISQWVEAVKAFDIPHDASALESEAAKYRLACKQDTRPTCIVSIPE